MKFKIGQRVRCGKYGGIDTITAYDPKTDTYTLESYNGMIIGYVSPGDITMYPVKNYEQLKLF